MAGNISPSKLIPKKSGMDIDLLWVFVVLTGFGIFVSLTPLTPNDFWWHLKIGQLIFQNGAIPNTNMFAWSLPADTSFTYGAWLGEYLTYLLYRVGNLNLVIFSRTVMVLIAFWLVASEASRRSGSRRVAALVTGGACLITLNNVIVRPQNWSWLPFMAFYVLLSRYAAGQLKARWLLTLPVVMIFWVNAHGAFILGPVLVGIFFLGEALRWGLKQPKALSLKQTIWIATIGGLTGLATLVNPRFIYIFKYVLNLMTDRSSQKLIIEWQSPTPTGFVNICFYILVLIVFLTFTYSRYRPGPTDILLIIGFLWLAWSGMRYVVWFGMVTMPILAEAIINLPLKKPNFTPQRNWLNVGIAAVLVGTVASVQPWFIERLPLPEAYQKIIWHHIPDGPLINRDTPVKAIDYLRSHPGGKLFNEMGYGSYIIWALPDQKVFIDPRVELYPYGQWQDYIRISNGIRYNELLNQYGADRILLDRKIQNELSQQLTTDPGWQLEYEDDKAQIWRKIIWAEMPTQQLMFEKDSSHHLIAVPDELPTNAHNRSETTTLMEVGIT